MRFYRLQSLFISIKNCIVVTDVIMTLLVPAELNISLLGRRYIVQSRGLKACGMVDVKMALTLR